MSATSKPLVNFSAGEVSPKMRGRFDVIPYFAGAETLENTLVTNYGTFYRRAGTRYVARTKYQNRAARMIRFRFSASQSYAMEFGHQYIRFFSNGGSVVETAKTITGITKANPAVVTIASHGYSNGDSIDIESVSGMTQVNGRRFKVANITSNTFQLQDEDGNNVDASAFGSYTSGGTAERVYEIVSPYSEADLPFIKFAQQADVVYLACTGFMPRKLSRYGSTNWTIAIPNFEWMPCLPVNTTATTITPSGTTGNITLTASTSIFQAGHVGTQWIVTYGSTSSYVKITAYTSGTVVSGTVNTVQALGGTTATADWNECAWSSIKGFPRDVKFFEQRLYYCSTTTKPITAWGSVPEEYENFQMGSNDDDAVSYTIGSETVDQLNWMYPTTQLVLGTQGGVFTMTGGTNGITPTSINVPQQNEDGASPVSPVRIGSFVYFLSRSGDMLGQLTYSLNTDTQDTKNMNYISDHVLTGGVAYMDLQGYPNKVLWTVRNDGVMPTFTRDIEQDVKAWTRQVIAGTNAKVESVCAIPNGSEDQVWVTVSRTINGSTRRYVEFFESTKVARQQDLFYVDSGLTYDGVATTSVTGLWHLEGQTVQVLADGAVHPDCLVTNGSITLNWSAMVVQTGLGYKSTFKSMDYEAGSITGTAQGKVKSIGRMMIRFLESLGCKFGNGSTMDVIPFRTSAMPMGQPPELFSGDKEVQFPSGHDKNKHIYITQEQPLPMHILGIFPKVMVSD
jgi:hypothetical protein